MTVKVVPMGNVALRLSFGETAPGIDRHTLRAQDPVADLTAVEKKDQAGIGIKCDPALRREGPCDPGESGKKLHSCSIPGAECKTAAIMPVPASVPPFTRTGPAPVAEPKVLVTTNVPWLRVIPPVKLFAPDNVKMPLPTLVTAPVP